MASSPMILLIALVLIDERVGGGVVDVLGVCDGGLSGEHVVYEYLRKLLVLAAGGDAHRVDEVVRALGVIEPEVNIVGLRRQAW